MRFLLRAIIELWVSLTGKKIDLAKVSWLLGPIGSTQNKIGPEYYQTFAAQQNLNLVNEPQNGLLQSFAVALRTSDATRTKLHPMIADFYEHTGCYKLDVWSEWYHPVKFFAHTIIKLLSSEMDQLNIPLRPLETSYGMGNEVISLQDKSNGNQIYACWLRRTLSNGKVVYAGFYKVEFIKEQPFVKVVFPLPKGNVTVLLRVEVQTDGSVKLISDGKKPGGAGYYRMQYGKNNTARYKFIPIKELIHVFVDKDNVLRTDHLFWFWKFKFLHLHYRMNRVTQ